MLENIKDNPYIEQKIELSNNYTSCIYCGIRTEEVLVQCGECDHKFCNGISECINNSHILYHFEKSRHNSFKYPKKKFNEELYYDNKNMEIISCGYCEEKNIYKIYFYKDEKNKKIEFLCESHFDKKIKEGKISERIFLKDNFKKIINSSLNKKNDSKYFYITPLLIQIPSKIEDLNLLNDCDFINIERNEEIIQQMDKLTNKLLNKVKLNYESSNEYYEIYKPLIYSEWTYTKKIFDMKPNFKIDLCYSHKDKIFYFYIDDDFIGINFSIEKRFRFSQEISTIEDLYNILNEEEKNEIMMPIDFIGIVVNIVHIKQNYCKKIEILPVRSELCEKIINNLGIYYMKENFCEVPYIRMIIGLEDFINAKRNHNNRNNNYTSNLIFSQILGIGDNDQLKSLEENELKDIFNENELTTKLGNYGELNTTQRKCLNKIFSHSLNMIQGPPGTGKTFLASFIIYNIFKKRKDSSDKILVCAPSNSAADNLAQYLLNLINSSELKTEEKEKMKILRVYPKVKELFENDILKEISLHNKLKILLEKFKKSKQEEKKKQNINNISNDQNNGDTKLFGYINNNNNDEKTKNITSNKNIDVKNNWEMNSDYLNENIISEKKDEENIVITPELIDKYVKYLINEHNIIVSTCSTSYDAKLVDIKFKYVLIDEATQCCEPEALLPIMHGSRYIVMIGDQRQLGPTIIYPKADLVGMKISLFERMIKLYPNSYYMLKKQYRMSPGLASFPSKFFYENKIKNSSRHEEKENKYIKKIIKKFYWVNKDVPIMFINTNNKSTFKYNKSPSDTIKNLKSNNFTSESDIGKSYQNELEAEITVKIISIFNSIKSLKKGRYDIGIITPYTGQKKLILEKLMYDNDYDIPYINYIKDNTINIASVDSFQGKEKDFIIINTVRSNEKNMIGFLKDIKRLNVSITRARHGLIIIGDAYCLAKSIGEKDNKYSIWRYLIKYYQDLGVIVDYIDGEIQEKIFRPTKIIDEGEELKDYEFNEYDFDGKNNKPLIKGDDVDNFCFYKNKPLDHYIDDIDFYNIYEDNFLYDEECIDEFSFNNDDYYQRYKYNERIDYYNEKEYK